MDSHRQIFNDWNTRNETLLQRIDQLENDTARIQHSIDAAQKEINQLHQNEHNWIKQQQKIHAYETIFDSNIHDIDTQTVSTNLPLLNPSQGSAATKLEQRRRRDITEQLLTSTARVCHKIERIWSDCPAQSNEIAGPSNSSNTDNNDISLDDCKSLQLDIKKIMEAQSSKDYLESLALLLQHDIDQYKQLLPNDGKFDTNEQDDDKEKDTPTPVTLTTEDAHRITEKMDWIEQQQKIRLQRVLELEHDTMDLKSTREHLETQLEQRIKERFSDLQVQDAFSDCVMSNVEKAQETSKLASFGTYLDELKHVASILEEKHANKDEIRKETMYAINSVVTQRKNIKTVKTINQCEPELCAQRKQVVDLMENIWTLQHEMNADMLDQQLPKETKSKNNDRLESPPMDLMKQSLGCLPSSAPDKVIEDMVGLLNRVHLLSSYQQTSVQNELEALALSWTEELKERKIDPPEEKPEEDAIDTVVGSARAIQEHVEKDWNDFVKQQRALLSNKVSEIEENQKYLDNIQLLLDERNYIRKGQIGSDYTSQDRNLEEWFLLLDQV